MTKRRNNSRLLCALLAFIAAITLCSCGASEGGGNAQTSGDTAAVGGAVEVVDAVQYTRESVFGVDHEVIVPKITGETEGIQALNQKLYDALTDCLETLEKGEEGKVVYIRRYVSRIYDGLIAILTERADGVSRTNFDTEWTGYYFDISGDCEITLEEYLGKLSLSKEDVAAFVSRSEAYQNEFGSEKWAETDGETGYDADAAYDDGEYEEAYSGEAAEEIYVDAQELSADSILAAAFDADGSDVVFAGAQGAQEHIAPGNIF